MPGQKPGKRVARAPALAESRAMSMENLTLLRAGKLTGATRLDLCCGLEVFPREIFDLADSLEVLNLSGNRLASLPEDLPRLHRLKILFGSNNAFTELPSVLGRCENLEMVGFRANRIRRVEDGAFPPKLRWLILTDNAMEQLPGQIGGCPRLKKLMLSGNRLATLPEALRSCADLEMIRLASNAFRQLPEWLLEMPRLCWLAMAGNPCTATEKAGAHRKTLGWEEMELLEKLGEGASGEIFRARLQDGRAVAVKLFKAAVTSDGLPSSEMAACFAAGNHPNLTAVLAELGGHPEAREGLLMELIEPRFGNLAGPPSFATCTRDIYEPQRMFSMQQILKMTAGLASAMAQLHARGWLHGDFYAHNVLWAESGECLLGDFGAAGFYQGMEKGEGRFERLEARAFGCLLEELLLRLEAGADAEVVAGMWALQKECCDERVAKRPLFKEIRDALAGLRDAP